MIILMIIIYLGLRAPLANLFDKYLFVFSSGSPDKLWAEEFLS